MEFGHFILVIVKLDCRVANDGNVCCASPITVILHSVSLKCISLSGILHYEYHRGGKGGWNLIYTFIHLGRQLMEKPYNRINFLLFFLFFVSQAIVTLRSRWRRAATAKARRTTLTGSRPTPERSPHQIHGCPQVREVWRWLGGEEKDPNASLRVHERCRRLSLSPLCVRE